MEHILLTKYLFHISKTPSPTCPNCQQSSKTVYHFILQCLVHHITRQSLWFSLGGRDISLVHLLSNLKPSKALIKFITETGRFTKLIAPPGLGTSSQGGHGILGLYIGYFYLLTLAGGQLTNPHVTWLDKISLMGTSNVMYLSCLLYLHYTNRLNIECT